MLVVAIDVGSPKNVGWSDSDGRSGSGDSLPEELAHVGARLSGGQPVAVGFEAPIWTPRHSSFSKLTANRGGAETRLNRAWSAGAGCGALGACLALMPWCFERIAEGTEVRQATTALATFQRRGSGLFVWEAFVTGTAKFAEHHEDARAAVEAFLARWPAVQSDIPEMPSFNHAATALYSTGFDVDPREFNEAALVVAATARSDR